VIRRRRGLAALLLALGVAAAPAASSAHDTEEHGAVERRPELELGRSEGFDYDPPEPGSYRLPPLKTAGDGRVLTADGAVTSLGAVLADRITVLSFIYTRCSDARGCPLATAVLHDLHYVSGLDPEIADDLQLVSFSFDPDFDSPEVMADYAARFTSGGEGGAPWRFLTAPSAEDLGPILAAYNQAVGSAGAPNDPFAGFNHPLRVFLIDRDLRIRNIYSLGFLDPRLVMTDVRTLLLEEREAVPSD